MTRSANHAVTGLRSYFATNSDWGTESAPRDSKYSSRQIRARGDIHADEDKSVMQQNRSLSKCRRETRII